MSDQIPLGLIGISHKTASVEIRERVALSEEEQKLAIRHMVDHFQVGGCMILSTCNRTEIYLSDDKIESKIEKIRSWLNEFKQCIEYTDQQISYELRDVAVVDHF